MPLNKDSNLYIIGFAAAVCIVCSIFVSGAAVSLRPQQQANAKLDLQKNVVSVSGLKAAGSDAESIGALFKEGIPDRIQVKYISLESGTALTLSEEDGAKKLKECSAISPNPAQLRCYTQTQKIYEVYMEGKLDRVILPVEGKGLWSTLKGFLAINKDGNTVKGLTFYSHAETPGLGGEIDNPEWKAKWPDKKAYNEKGAALRVSKGSSQDENHEIDGLSGATLTSNGVTDMVQFWLGEKGYGPYLKKMQTGGS